MGYCNADVRAQVDVLGPLYVKSRPVLYSIHLYLVWDTQVEGMPWHGARPPNKTCLLYLWHALVYNQAPKGEGISWFVWLLLLCQLVCNQSGAGECKGCNGCAAQSMACNTVLYCIAPMWVARTMPQQVQHIYLALCQPQWGTIWLETVLITLLGLVNQCDLFKVRLGLTIGFRSWFYVFLAFEPG